MTTKKKHGMLSAVSLLCLLSATIGCDRKAATNGNFEDGINRYFKRNPECLFNSSMTWPQEYWGDRADWDALVGAGLVSKTEIRKNYFSYALTSSAPGTKGAGDAAQLCYGSKKVVDVLNFTEPSDSAVGRISEVVYTWKLMDVPDWAKNIAVQKAFPQLAEAVKDDPSGAKYKSHEELVLTNHGWRRHDDL